MTDHNFSIEFFPPKTPEGADKLRTACAKLAELNPKYFSVTYGAGGSTQQGTLSTVLEIMQAGHEAAPHLSCVGSTRDGIAQMEDSMRKLQHARMDAFDAHKARNLFRRLYVVTRDHDRLYAQSL